MLPLPLLQSIIHVYLLSITSLLFVLLCTRLINTYKSPVLMIIPGNGEITSSKGTTQGDPLAMAMYNVCLGCNSIIQHLKSVCPVVSSSGRI